MGDFVIVSRHITSEVACVFIYKPSCMAVSSDPLQRGACFLFTSHLAWLCPPIQCKVARVFYLRATLPGCVLQFNAKWRVFFIYEPPHLHLSSDPLQSGACFLFTSHLTCICPPIHYKVARVFYLRATLHGCVLQLLNL